MSDLLERIERRIATTNRVGGDMQARDMLAEAAAELTRLRAERRWIPVEERLPEGGIEVLTWIPSEWCMSVATWSTFHKEWQSGDARADAHSMFEPDGVTHWQPLPVPPEATP